MGGNIWKIWVALFVFGVSGCASPPPLPTPMATAVLPIPTAQPTSQPTDTPSPMPAPTGTALFSTTMPTTIPVTPETALAQPTITATVGISSVIGYSAGKRPLIDYQFGDGSNQIVLVGGIHGGYEWNTILLAYQMIDYFRQHPEELPMTATLHIIPSANPDGQFVVTGKNGRFSLVDVDLTADHAPGRFNDNGVDLNRNWDCNWRAEALWRDNVISAGTAPFSESETAVLREFLLDMQPTAVIFLHSAANGIYGAGCVDLYQPAYELARLYGTAAAYPVHESFDYYQVTGDATDWLALQGIPAITVELETHEALDWEKNWAGITAVLNSSQSDASPEPTRSIAD